MFMYLDFFCQIFISASWFLCKLCKVCNCKHLWFRNFLHANNTQKKLPCISYVVVIYFIICMCISKLEAKISQLSLRKNKHCRLLKTLLKNTKHKLKAILVHARWLYWPQLVDAGHNLMPHSGPTQLSTELITIISQYLAGGLLLSFSVLRQSFFSIYLFPWSLICTKQKQ